MGPDVLGGRVVGPEAFRRGYGVVADGPVAVLDIDGYDFAVVGGLDLVSNFPLVDLVAQAGRHFLRAIRGGWRVYLAGWKARMASPS